MKKILTPILILSSLFANLALGADICVKSQNPKYFPFEVQTNDPIIKSLVAALKPNNLVVDEYHQKTYSPDPQKTVVETEEVGVGAIDRIFNYFSLAQHVPQTDAKVLSVFLSVSRKSETWIRTRTTIYPRKIDLSRPANIEPLGHNSYRISYSTMAHPYQPVPVLRAVTDVAFYMKDQKVVAIDVTLSAVEGLAQTVYKIYLTE